MNNKIAWFILTHNRAEKQCTLATLEKMGIVDDVFLVIDDKDPSKDKYFELYDNVEVFSKDEMYDKIDTMTNARVYNSVVYTRNFVYELAEQKGYDFFVMCDDDITAFTIRAVKDEKLKSFSIKDGRALFDAMADYMKDAPIALLGGVQAGGYIGGKDGCYKQKFKRDISQLFMCKTNTRIAFDGIINQDEHGSLRCMLYNQVALSLYCLCITSPKRKSNDGGLYDLYKKLGDYVQPFYTIIAHPYGAVIKLSDEGLTLSYNRNAMYPKIIEEKYKK